MRQWLALLLVAAIASACGFYTKHTELPRKVLEIPVELPPYPEGPVSLHFDVSVTSTADDVFYNTAAEPTRAALEGEFVTSSLWSQGDGGIPDGWPTRVAVEAGQVGTSVLGIDLANQTGTTKTVVLVVSVIVNCCGEVGPDEDFLTIELTQR